MSTSADCPRCYSKGMLRASFDPDRPWIPETVCLACGFRPQSEAERRASERIARAEGKQDEVAR